MWLLNPYRFGTALDADAAAYIAAVEAADGQALEAGVRTAINAFVVGCKADGIWNAIKASCILAGARTLAGALVPLVGTAPTNFNFVSGDYNRKTGLRGNGTNKYLNSNRNNNADPQDSKHVLVRVSQTATVQGGLFGTQTSSNVPGDCYLYSNPGPAPTVLTTARLNSSGSGQPISLPFANINGSAGLNRSSSASFTAFLQNTLYTSSPDISRPPINENFTLYRVSTLYTNSRLSFYSIGQSLDLALLDARVTTLINAFAAAIP